MHGLDLQGLSEAEQDELYALCEAEYDYSALADFIRQHCPREPPPKHLEPLLNLIERARRGERVRACLHMPPRHSKTTTILRGLVWYLMSAQADTCAYASYSGDIGWEKSGLARNFAVQVGLPLATDSKAKNLWKTPAGGGMYGTGVDGPLTGRGVDGLMIVDDPFSNYAQAASPTIRENVWKWFNGIVYTRLQKNASVIVIHTRWHPDDLIGRLLKQGRWEHVSLPAIAHADDLLGRAEGEALWPDEFPLERLLEIKRQIGPFLWAALYDGNPLWEGGKLFDEPARFHLADFKLEGKRACIALDPAATKKAASDWSAIIIAAMEGFGVNTKMYILDVVRLQTTVPNVVRRVLDLQRKWGLLAVVEAVGGFKAVPQYLREISPALRVHEITPSVDKLQRALPVSAAWSDGRVLVPDDAPWVAEYLAEMTAFTGVNDVHDDQVDATAHAWNAMYRDGRPRGGRTRRVAAEWSPG